MSSFLEWQYWGLPCFLGWLNLKFDISKKQKMMHRSFQTFNLQPILRLKITSIHLLLFISMKILSLKQQSTTLLFSSSWDYSRLIFIHMRLVLWKFKFVFRLHQPLGVPLSKTWICCFCLMSVSLHQLVTRDSLVTKYQMLQFKNRISRIV